LETVFIKKNLIFRGYWFLVKQKEETPTSSQNIGQTEIKRVALHEMEPK